MPLVRALDDVPGLRAVLCLFEGVCTGAADGYGRMADKPALTLLHLGPGFANGIAYLHDARRARSPIVNLIGEHSTWHLPADPPLATDIESLARPVSAWLRRNQSAEELAADTAAAIAAASVKPGQIATLIVPHDYQLNPASGSVEPHALPTPPEVSEAAIEQAAQMLRSDQSVALFLGGHALRERGLRAAARIAATTGCELLCETFPARLGTRRRLADTQATAILPGASAENSRALSNDYSGRSESAGGVLRLCGHAELFHHTGAASGSARDAR